MTPRERYVANVREALSALRTLAVGVAAVLAAVAIVAFGL